ETEAGQVFSPPYVAERARTDEENERGRAEVRHPPSEKNPRRGTTGGESGIDADVIDRHQDHDRTANQIDGRDARGCGDRGGGSGRGDRRTHGANMVDGRRAGKYTTAHDPNRTRFAAARRRPLL